MSFELRRPSAYKPETNNNSVLTGKAVQSNIGYL